MKKCPYINQTFLQSEYGNFYYMLYMYISYVFNIYQVIIYKITNLNTLRNKQSLMIWYNKFLIYAVSKINGYTVYTNILL